MKLKNPLKNITKFEIILWSVSVVLVTVAFSVVPKKDWLTLIVSLIGVTTLVFEAKGEVFGQILTLVFSVVYGIVSFRLRYYGEMITRLGMTAPLAILAIVSWIRHPYKDSSELAIGKMTRNKLIVMLVLTPIVATAFYFILDALGTANVIFSTVATGFSFAALYLMLVRSPFYALGFVLSDGTITVLWILAAIEDISNLPMVICFAVFIVIDVYGFVNWRRMERKQKVPTTDDDGTNEKISAE